MLQRVSEPKAQLHGRRALAENDKILRRKGLKHLLSESLISRETRVLAALTLLRQDILGKQFIRVTDHSGYVAARSTVNESEVRKRRIEFRRASSEFATVIDMTDEYTARRRERQLTAELAAVDALWAQRGKALASNGRTRSAR